MRDVLVRIADPSDFDRDGRAAARVAANLHGSLTAFYAVPVGMPPPSLYDPTAMAAEWAMRAQNEVRCAAKHEAAFVAWATSMGVRDPVWSVGAGNVPELMAFAAGWHDLLVLGVEHDGPDPWSTAGGVARTVLAAGVSCLVLPQGIELQPPCGTVAVAWNGSTQVIRTLHAALPLLAGAHRVVVLTGRVPETSTLGPAFRLEQWLESRVQRVEYRPLAADRQDGAGILEASHKCEADLLVMGAYGRSRTSEWLLGGVTRHMLEQADLPMILRH